MSRTRVLIVISLAASLLMIGVGMIVGLLPRRVLAFSGSIRDVGLVASCFALTYLLLQVPIGRLADRFGIKKFLIAGYVLCGVSGLMFSYANSPRDIFIGRLIQGAGEAPIWALGPALLALAYPRESGRAIGIHNASIHAGLTLGPLAGLWCFPAGTGRTPFLVFAFLCFAAMLLILLLLPSYKVSHSKERSLSPKLGDVVRLLALRSPFMTLSGVLIYGACYGVFISVLPGHLILAKGFNNVSVGIFFALFYLSVSLSQLIAGPLSDRFGRHLFMVAGLVMVAIGLATFVHIPYPLVFLPLILASLGLGIFCVASLAHLNEFAPNDLKASISGSYYLAWGLGYFLGPLVLGYLDEHVDSSLGYYLLALVCAIQALQLLIIAQKSAKCAS